MTIALVRPSSSAFGSFQPLYTCPGNKRAILRSIFQGSDGPVVDAEMGVLIRGVGFIYSQKVSQFDSRAWPLRTVLNPGDTLTVTHTQGGQYTMAEVVELDAAKEGAQLWGLTMTSVTTEQLWTVPTGKRLIVKEVVIANHADSANYNVYVSGLYHLVKAGPQPRVAIVQALDVVLKAGESIGGVSSGGPAPHFHFSGYLEDA